MLSFWNCSQSNSILPGSSSLDKEFASELVTNVPNNWFQKPKAFSLQSDDVEVPSHFFYDVNPDIKLNKTVSVVIETPEGSPYQYKIDLVSGQHYMNHQYCELKDFWGRYKGDIEKPPFSIGIVPRILDQAGTPQKILVFGDKNYIQEHFMDNFFDVRVVGGFIEQFCEKGACLDPKTWKSRLVLVGIQTGYTQLEDVNEISELQKEVDWPKVRAFVENAQGQNKLGKDYFSAFKMGFPIDSQASLDFLKNNSIFFTVERLTTMRNSCYKLYDEFWEKTGELSEIEKRILQAKSLAERAKLEKLARRTKDGYFFRRFIRNFKKYERELKTCFKYIYYGNHHDDPERFWYFTFLNFFTKAHEEGYTYSCTSRNWVRNPLLASGQRAKKLKDEFIYCDGRELDQAFSNSLLLMSNLKRNHAKSYRFIDYDRGVYGTHKKLYSIVPIPLQKYQCSKGSEYYLKAPVFPKDIKWKKRDLSQMSSGKLN